MTIPTELIELKDDIIASMVSYMKKDNQQDFDDYCQENIDDCENILSNYLTNVLAPAIHGNTEHIMAIVKNAIMSLNDLNLICNESLIETDQREGICNLINSAARLAGLSSDYDDITEEWREW